MLKSSSIVCIIDLSATSQKNLPAAAKRAEPIVREIMSRSPEVEWELKVEASGAAWMVKTLIKDPEIELVISTRHRGGLRVLKAPLGARRFTDECRKASLGESSTQVDNTMGTCHAGMNATPGHDNDARP